MQLLPEQLVDVCVLLSIYIRSEVNPESSVAETAIFTLPDTVDPLVGEEIVTEQDLREIFENKGWIDDTYDVITKHDNDIDIDIDDLEYGIDKKDQSVKIDLPIEVPKKIIKKLVMPEKNHQIDRPKPFQDIKKIKFDENVLCDDIDMKDL